MSFLPPAVLLRLIRPSGLSIFRNNLLGRPEKKKTISRQKAYHGSTYLAASISGKERDRLWLDKADDLAHCLPDENPLYLAPGQSEEGFLKEKVSDLENAIVTLGPENVAAFITESVLASGGVIVPPKKYHESCPNICRKYDVPYISDEVVTACPGLQKRHRVTGTMNDHPLVFAIV
ncbi:aminotransferase class III-fold pyridoxal phosphate-dependent enzyme [Ruegeria sp. AU67]|uniref:aminotransferase class III-fold pyridoxal phosphate-dependent enzyme n=1 Tax=Ruegeria sp. AU67 TaxID=2108530 RepID=UPI001F2AFDBA|nr:aminotransferase class III-fold pyridoxal phosphate-dependent enzyme [Ruegeria sp. AU67]